MSESDVKIYVSKKELNKAADLSNTFNNVIAVTKILKTISKMTSMTTSLKMMTMKLKLLLKMIIILILQMKMFI